MNKTKKLTFLCLFLFCLNLIGFGIYKELKINRYTKQIEDIPTLEQFEQNIIEKELSKNVIAWIELNDTNINYPILQGEDNYEYLNKNCYDENNLVGSIFLDNRNNKDLQDDYNLIYGHNVQNTMFGNLYEFKNEGYFNTHRFGKIVIDNKEYKIKTFAFMKIGGDDLVIFNFKEVDLLNYIRKHSLIFEEPYTDKQYIALTTCVNSTSIDRWVLICEYF